MRVRCLLPAVVLALCALSATQAGAQRGPYRDPDPQAGAQRGPYRDPGTQAGRTDQAGQFDYYLLALSWSPTFCAGQAAERHERQCAPRDGRPYAFVLHGLWPQRERGWPQNCSTDDRGFVPRETAERMLDIMPSERLVFQQYRKHGTCSGLGIDGYFALARQLYSKINIPRRYVGLTDERLFVGPDELVREFMAANPELQPDMIAVVCGGPGNRLREVRICFNKSGQLRACGRSVDQQRLCTADRMYVPPVRTGPADGAPQDRSAPGRRPPPQERTL